MIWLSRSLRALAVLIAIAAAIDPAMALIRADRALVAVVDAGGSETTTEIAKRLAESFDVNRGPIAGAAATVIVGDALPASPIVTSGVLIAVTPPPAAQRVELVDVSAPAVASSGSKIPIVVRARAVGMRGRSLVAELFVGSLAVDSMTQVVTNDDASVDLTLAMPPSGAGLANARVIVRDVANRSITRERGVAVDVRDQRWRVLVADPRPSWTSTFVRRALETDRRFDLASRVGTSKSVGVESGPAPALTDTSALSAFDAIVIGAPDALTAADVRSLERYARERGGSIVLLLDRPALGPLSPLVGDPGLSDLHGVERVKISSAAGTLVATELAVPRRVSGLTTLAHASVAGTGGTPIVWSSALGAGRVVVNGALDAWRYRTREGGGFAAFWSDAIGAAAAASPAPLVLTTGTPRVAPGAIFDVRAIVREAQLSDPSRPAPAVELDGPPDFWPAAERGVFHASVTAPAEPGNYEIKLRDAVLRYLVISKTDAEPAPALLGAWTTSRGGTVISDDVAGAVPRIRSAVNARKERVETHPMRSAWWLPAFVLLLGGEWWLRRRRGER